MPEPTLEVRALANALLPDVWRDGSIAVAFRRAFETQVRKDRFAHNLVVPIGTPSAGHQLYLDYGTKPATYTTEELKEQWNTEHQLQRDRDLADELRSQEEHRDIGWGA